MVNIDYTTLALVLAVIYIIVAITFFVLLKINTKEKGLKVWLISSVMSIIDFAALFTKDIIAPYGQLLGTSLLLTSTYLIIEGVLRFRNIGSKQKRRKFHIIFITLFFVIGALTTDNSTVRYLIMDALLLLMCPIIVVSILKGTKGIERKLSFLFAGAFIFEGIWFAIRWALALNEAFGHKPVTDHPYLGTIYFASIVWLLCYIFSVLLIISYRAQARLQFFAEKDALTGLCNRRKLDLNFKSLIGANKPKKGNFAVFLMDINGFKAVNDTYGHIFGDMLLVELAKKIKMIIRTEDFACRYGGDEFIIVLKLSGGKADAVNAKDRIKKLIEEPFESDRYKIFIKIAIGFVVIENHEITLDEILIKADKNMYSEKDLNYETTQIIETDKAKA